MTIRTSRRKICKEMERKGVATRRLGIPGVKKGKVHRTKAKTRSNDRSLHPLGKKKMSIKRMRDTVKRKITHRSLIMTQA